MSLLPPIPLPEYLRILIGTVHPGVERTLRMLTTPISKNSQVTLIKAHMRNLRTYIKHYTA